MRVAAHSRIGGVCAVPTGELAALSRNDAVGRAIPPHPGPLPGGEGVS